MQRFKKEYHKAIAMHLRGTHFFEHWYLYNSYLHDRFDTGLHEVRMQTLGKRSRIFRWWNIARDIQPDVVGTCINLMRKARLECTQKLP